MKIKMQIDRKTVSTTKMKDGEKITEVSSVNVVLNPTDDNDVLVQKKSPLAIGLNGIKAEHFEGMEVGDVVELTINKI